LFDTNVQSTSISVSAEIDDVAQSEAGVDMRTESNAVWRSVFLPGAHIVTSRRGYSHHGIYVGEEKVVHYAGSTHGLLSGPIEEISIDIFTGGRRVWATCDAPANFASDEVISRARSRVGENHYRLFSNNCEHFCEWCLRGEHRSYQVEAWLLFPRYALETFRGLKAKLLSSLGKWHVESNKV
jgi:hypothetical protein